MQESEDPESEYVVEVANSDVDELQSEDEDAPVSNYRTRDVWANLRVPRVSSLRTRPEFLPRP